MNAALQTQAQAPTKSFSTPVPAALLQRKCACGGSAGLQGDCDDCSNDRLKLHRETRNSGGVPPVVDEVLNSPGQPLGAETRAFMEPRFGHSLSRITTRPLDLLPSQNAANLNSSEGGFEMEADRVAERVIQSWNSGTTDESAGRLQHDFSQVRVHTDAKAAESADAMGAAAYAVGKHVVFGATRYAPETSEGRRLLAHELAHVVQQSAISDQHQNGAPIQMARLPCTNRKKLDVYGVSLPGATRNVDADLRNANSIFCQCGLELNLAGGESWETDLMNRDAPNDVLNEYSSTGSPTTEEIEMLDHQPGGTALHFYYVPSLSRGNEAESFWTSGFPTVNNGVAISNGARDCAVAHEIGHVLLNDGGHHPIADNLMAKGSANTCAGDLEQTQCDLMP